MEVLQCDGCDFHAESYDDLKIHIQEVHTAFLQPADADESESPKDDDEEEVPDDEEDDRESYDKHSSSSLPGMSPNSETPKEKDPSESTLSFYQCKFCVRYFRSKSFLKNHTKKVHNIRDDQSDVHNSRKTSKDPSYTVVTHNDHSKVYSCQYCTYKSPRKARIIKHQIMYHQVPSEGAEDHLNDAEAGDDCLSAGAYLGGTFACEWCDFQTDEKDSWTDHVAKEHSDKVKIISSVEELEGEASSSKPDSPSSPRSPASEGGIDGSTGRVTPVNTMGTPDNNASVFHYVMPNSTGSSILSKRFPMADSNCSPVLEMDASLRNEEDSRSSMEEDDEELVDIDDPSYTGTLSADVKQLLTDEDNKVLEAKGVQIRKQINRFQCPFCSFLTMHRRSISRHIENIHFSGKTTVYKCDECPFICTSSLKLGTHKQSHGGSDVDAMDITNSLDTQNEPAAESLNGGNVIAKVNGKRSSPANDHPNPHQCSLCTFSTTTLKGLRVHQQHKHSYCDDVETEAFEEASADQPDTEVENSPTFLQKTQTSILRPSTKKNPTTGKRARKSINDLPLDLSSVKKRTRIDEIASNLQSKISQSQQDMIINLDELDDEEGGGSHRVDDHDDSNLTAINPVFTYNIQQILVSEPTIQGGRVGKRKSNPKSKPRNIPISLTLSDDSENVSGDLTELQDNGNQDNRDTFQENAEYSEDPGAVRFYCKHCDYHNKSARSVSTHYQRMHPYIKFSFKYILDPEDHSAVFRCLECYIEYPNYNDLHQHYMDHHPEASNVLNFNQPDLVYMCRFCAYTSPNVRSLMPHYQRMHPTVKINNAMIFSSYVVEQSHKTGESQTLREILNSGPKNFSSATSTPRSSSSPALKSPSKTPEASVDSEALKEAMGGNVVVYECDVCSFASPNMHSVLVHYQKKHPEQKASYFRIQKTMKIITTDKAQSPAANSSFNVSSTSPPSKSSSATTYGTEEDIYYCKHCVYSNRSVVGVLVHYQKRHPEVKVTAKYIKHGAPTPVLMKLIDDLQIATPKQFSKPFQSNGYDGSFNSSPKIGNGEKGEAEMLFFCQHCDYGNRTVKGVLIHYQKKHRDAKANADLVRRHTAVVRSQRERAQMVQSGTVATTITQAPVDPESSGELRSLLCRHCPYTSPYVYALKKHLKKEHPTVKATAMTILHWAYQDGILEAGYHCEWCIYSHAEPQGLLLHYQRRHPEHNVDYTYMASKLWAGPETTQQGPNSLENKHFRCQECAFEACTIWDITSHYQAVHPWAMKAEESVIFDMIKGNITTDKILQQLVNDHAPSSGQSEDDGALIIASPLPETISHPTHPRLCISNNPYQCTVCLSEYNSLHGLLTHYGKKHPGMKVKAADFAQEADINPSSVYKCRHCPYVNSRIHGVLTHYQKRHPLVKVTAEDFADDIEHIADLNEGEDKCKTQRQGYGAYRCKICTYTHGTLEKLKIHYEKYHNQPAAEMFPHTFSSFSPSKEGEPVAECSVSNVSAVTDMLEVKEYELPKSEKHAIFKCQLCKYFCSTRKGIARHYRIKHNNVRAQPEGKNNVFKCALCSYTNPIRKGLAAHYQKRHDIDAYYTHCLAASKTLSDKPVKVMAPEKETTEMSEDLRLAVETRKCSLCSFQAFSRKSIVSHYIKRHPGVFPKKQHSSKLGRYFTLIYAKEPENPPETAALEEEEEVKEEFEVQSMPNHQADEEWPPFKCLKCGQLSFDTIELLSMHYNDDHSSDLKRDFQSNAGEDGSELHQCSHCELKFLELPVLAKHIVDHNDDFQKKALKQERRKLLSKQKALELAEGKSEKQESPVNKAPIGFRCNFCVEVHPTLRAICNHLRKHVQYGEVKQGHVKMETSEEPLTPQHPPESLTNGQPEEEGEQGAEGVCLDDGDAVDDGPSPTAQDLLRVTALGHPPDPAATAGPPVALLTPGDDQDDQLSAGAVAMAMTPTPTPAPAPSAVVGGLAGALVAAARAIVAGGGQPKQQRLAAGGYPCGQCDRVFMSMQGLRSHERSHSAMALFSREDKYSCQYCQFVSPFRHNLDRHVQSHHGHHKPFKCKFCPFKSSYLSRLKSHLHKAHAGEHSSAYQCLSCPFSSTTISLLKEHSLRDHGEELTLSKLRAATQAALRTPKLAGDDAELPGALGPEDPLYLEPADVRQQLTHYQMASQQSSAPAHGGSPTASDSRPDAVLTCEFCEFSSGYMQSLRRHYRDRHGGKKLFKCKDCAFFTCYKNTFTTHVAAGHAPSASDEPARDLRCPLCLYHTKHKSNMIDHVVLHREERTVPLEVSRSKLSRHLQGLVFRCQQCTFTCSSNKALQQHLLKHTVLRPYHCQLCYYDSGRRDQLEEHLRLEHKVVRNFELMGRVNLDQLEMMKDFSSSAEEEGEKQEQQQEDQEEGEEEMMAVDMVTDGRVSFEEQEEGEDGEDMEAAESAEAEQREANDGVMAEHEEEVEREEGEVAVKEVTEKPVTQEDTASPGSCCSSSSGVTGLEKRLPCEFCGRCFTNSTEWERHVLRHGMLLNPMDTDPSAAPEVLEAPGPPPAETSFPTDPGLDLSSHRKEEQVKRKRKEEEEEDNGPSTDSLQTAPDQYMENKESL